MSKQTNSIVKVLVEALPYIQKFKGKIIVIKYGGNAMTDEVLKSSFARDVVLMKSVGMVPIVVHGGGPQIGKKLTSIGKKTEFWQGMRITDDETMTVVEEVLQDVNSKIAALIHQHGGEAIGFGSTQNRLIDAKKFTSTNDNTRDLGFVGQVADIDTSMLKTTDAIPIIAPLGLGSDGHCYNINADLVAGAVATKMAAEKLILLTNTVGIIGADEQLLSSLDVATVAKLIDNGTIHGGMLPKITCALEAVKHQVSAAHIIDGRVAHAVLLEVFTDTGVGTLIK